MSKTFTLTKRGKKQSGFTLIELLFAVVIIGGLILGAVYASQQKKAQTAYSNGLSMITAAAPEALTSWFEQHGGSFIRLGGATFVAADAKSSLMSRGGLQAELPWAQAWSVVSRTATQVVIDWPCAEASGGCADVISNITALRLANPISNTTTKGIISVASQGTGAAEAARVTYGRP